MSRIKQVVGEFWAGEGERRVLWLPVLLAAGMAIYYALPSEPAFAPLAAAVFVLGLLTFLTPRAVRPFRLFIIAVFLVFLGMAMASLHTLRQPHTILRTDMNPRPVSGVLEDIERVENGLRFTLADVSITNMKPEAAPHRVRLSIRLRADDATPLPLIGSRVEMIAGLLPPMGPATPGGFDFSRYFFFREIGAIGYGLPPWKITETPERGLHAQFQQWRFEVTERILTQLGPRHGPIAAGLITGEDRAIAEEDFRDLRASNLYHIIAISGGHMVVIAGVIFFALRALFLFSPWGLRPQAKSIAAALTLIMVTLYLFVTGMPISAVRAYVMIALVLSAVILRREVDGMRSLLLAALIMLAIDPSDLFEPGFQLSFVATLAIVAMAEARWLNPPATEQPRWRFALRLMGAAVMISIVAEGATSLLVLSMFNTLAPYGVPANALASLLVAFVIMPTVALFFLLLPFGLEQAALVLMDYGITGMMAIAHTISDLPYALVFTPGPPGWGVALWVLGLLILCIVRQRPRYVGAVLMLVAIASTITTRSPDMLVGPELKQVALRHGEGYALARGRVDSMVPELWANAVGFERFTALPRGDAAWRCDRFGCVGTVKGKRIAMPLQAIAVAEDCAQSDLVLSTLRVYRCKAPLIGPKALGQGGVHAAWVEGDAMRIETSADWQGNRPWSLNYDPAR